MNYKQIKLGDICESISETFNKKSEKVIPVNTSNVFDGNLIDLDFLPVDQLKGQFKKTFKKDDILFSEIRPKNKRFALISNEETDNFVASTKLMVIRSNLDVIRPYFLYLILTNPRMLNALQAQAESRSGTFPQITFGSTLAQIEINLPDLRIQDKIIFIIQSIDKYIELQKRINRNLEEQIDLIFNHYYNEINLDTNQVKIGDVCDCLLGGTPSRKISKYWNGNIPWINSGEINKFRIDSPTEYISEEGLNNSSTKLLPKRTTVIAITGATLGQVSLLEIESCANQSVIGILENDQIPHEFIYPLIKSKIKELIKSQTGGAQQHINNNNVKNLTFNKPNPEILLEYKERVKELFDTISINLKQINTLSSIRDFLLPKLISGQIDVSELDI